MNGNKTKKVLVFGCMMPLLMLFVTIALIGLFIGGNNKTNSSIGFRLKSVASLNDEQLERINDIFSLCQINEIVDAKQFQVGENRTSYHINDKETQRHGGADYAIILWLNNTDKSVQAIYYNDNIIYEDGQLINVITKFYIPKDLYEEYRVVGQLALRQYMKHPDTIKYKNWRDGVLNGVDVIQVEISSKNDFNLDISSQVQFEYDRNRKQLTKILIDGRQVY